ncbi:secretin N-terminal domain-containing protein [Salmonella enterica]|nr:secretin N-terminal domain-containing protein [Salmonella enterica]ELQ9574247.1 secretin N-terminal domain-containing protein [Salmonella enterica]
MTRKRYNVRLRLAATVVAAVLSLSGCTFQEMDRMSRKAQASGDIAREHVSEQMRSSQGALVWTDKPWVNLKPVPTVSRDTPLENFPDCQITLARDGLTLPEIGERITALCGVRVIFSPDALAVGQSSGTTRALNGPLPTPDNNGRIPLDQLGGAVDRAGVTATPLVLSGLRWQGKLSGLLDMIAARTGLTPRMDNGAILFSLLETRTFQFTFLNTNITSNASVTSGSTSSMGTSGGTTNSSVSGDSSSSQQTTVDQSRNVYDDMKKTLETMLTPQKGRFWLSASTGTLTVTDNRESDYVNTDMVLNRDRLLSVMQFMLDEVALNPDLREKCRQAERILTFWIRGLDALAEASYDMAILPRTVSECSGRVDRLLPGDPQALLALPDDAFLCLTGQGDLMSGEQFPRELLEATLPYWTRFMAWTARELYQTEDRCLVQLGRLFRRLIVEPRKVRSFNLSFGRIELHMSGRDINECQYLYAYDDASLEDYLEEIMAGNLTPVRFEARVLYHNDSELNVFTRDTDVIDVEHPHVSDWQTVVSEALDWIRQERASLNKITTLRPTLKLAA